MTKQAKQQQQQKGKAEANGKQKEDQKELDIVGAQEDVLKNGHADPLKEFVRDINIGNFSRLVL